jgi:hypothetical protein
MSRIKVRNIDTGLELDKWGFYVGGTGDIKRYVKSVVIGTNWNSYDAQWFISVEYNWKLDDFMPLNKVIAVTASTDEMRSLLNEIVDTLMGEHPELFDYTEEDSKESAPKFKI